MRIKNFCFLSVSILFMGGCVDAQLTKEVQMKETSLKLMNHFLSKDTTQIRNLFEVKNNPSYKRETKDLIEDCDFFKKVVDKYGFPRIDSLRLTKGATGENVIYVTLVNKEDSELGLKSCQLGVLFFPTQFLADPSKILTYQLVKIPLHKPEMKLEIIDF